MAVLGASVCTFDRGAGPSDVTVADLDLDLVDRARTGDHDAFAVLVRAASSRLYGTAKLILRDPERAEDAVQEALMVAWRNIGALRDPHAWHAWLYRLTVRECQRLAASQRRHLVAEALVKPRNPAQPDFSQAVDDRDRMGRELERLPVDQRTVIVLHFYLDLPLTDAAAILDIPIGTAKSRLHRGLDAMRTGIRPEAELPLESRASS